MKRVLVWYVGVGIVMLVVWNLVLLAVSLASAAPEGQGPPLLPMVAFALVMAVIVAVAVRWAKPRSDREAYGLSATWSLICLGATLLVAIGNQTVGVFFGHWYSWLVFVAMAGAPVLLKALPVKQDVKP